MQDRRHHAFTGKTVQGPEQDAVKPAFVGVLEQCSELLAALGALPAALVVNVFVGDLVAGASAPLAQLAELVLGILAFIVSGDASVDSYAHLLPCLLRD